VGGAEPGWPSCAAASCALPDPSSSALTTRAGVMGADVSRFPGERETNWARGLKIQCQGHPSPPRVCSGQPRAAPGLPLPTAAVPVPGCPSSSSGASCEQRCWDDAGWRETRCLGAGRRKPVPARVPGRVALLVRTLLIFRLAGKSCPVPRLYLRAR